MEITIADIIKIVSGIILGFIFSIVSAPIKNWISFKDHRQCDYRTANNYKVETHQIIVKKRFGKTTDINCYWFNRREQKELDGIKYLHCVFGEKFFNASKTNFGNRCPFDNKK
jgi:hypothetical protein